MIYVRGWRSHSNLLYTCVIIKIFIHCYFCLLGSCKHSKLCQCIDSNGKETHYEMRRTTLGVIIAPLRVHCVVTRLLSGHAAILYVARLSNKTAINRMVHAAHAHISFDVSRLYTPPTVMDS